MKKGASLSILFLFFLPVILLSYQNCGDVGIKPAEESLASRQPLGEVKATICPSLSLRGQTSQFRISQAYLLNLSSTLYQGRFLVDSDADGVSDTQEQTLGMNPTLRRSRGLLDSVCLRTGTCTLPPTGCSNQPISPGLTDCDLQPFSPPAGAGVYQGFDSEQVGIPDLIEFLRGTNPILPDANAHNDSDDIPNIVEIQTGHDVSNIRMTESRHRLSYNTRTISETCNGIQNLIEMRVENLPLVETLAVTDDKVYTHSSGRQIDFSHLAGENIIAFVYIAEPMLGSGPKEMYFQIVKIHVTDSSGDFILQPDDFLFLGEIL